MVVRSIFSLGFNFPPILKGEPHIVPVVDGYEIHQSAPEGGVKFLHQVSLRQRVQKGFDCRPSGFLVGNGGFDFLQPCLCSIETGGEAVIAFLVLRLVERHMSVFVDAFFDKV